MTNNQEREVTLEKIKEKMEKAISDRPAASTNAERQESSRHSRG
jgi:hypothetical protein